MAERDTFKRQAAERVLPLVRTGMVLGLGTGSTARYFIDALAPLVAGGLRVTAVPTSRASAELALAAGIPLIAELDRPVDLAVDGADEIDPRRDLVKGRGGALFREKLVAYSAERFVVIGDSSKLVDRLGVGVVPVEVLPFMWRQTARRLASALGVTWDLRGGPETPYKTDNGNVVVDLTFPAGIAAPGQVAAEIKEIMGVIEHGIFIGMTTACVVAGPSGLQVLGSLE